MTLEQVSSWMRCPSCSDSLSVAEQTLRCATNHCFDIAKQGYVNLLGRQAPKNADTSAMLAARDRFLRAGHYQPIADVLARRLGRAKRILEVGAGTGYYLASVLSAHPNAIGLATDVSPAACRRAAKAHPRMAAVVADTWAGLPLRSSSVDALLCVFAPRNPNEFFRVLTADGVLIVVTPEPEHLEGLRTAGGLLGIGEHKEIELRRSLVALEPISTQKLRYSFDLEAAEVNDLIDMGPNAFHDHPRFESSTKAEASVRISVFRKAVAW